MQTQQRCASNTQMQQRCASNNQTQKRCTGNTQTQQQCASNTKTQKQCASKTQTQKQCANNTNTQNLCVSRCPLYDYITFNELKEIFDLFGCYCSTKGTWTTEFIILFLFTFFYFLVALVLLFYILRNLEICFSSSKSMVSKCFLLSHIWCMLLPRLVDLNVC